MPSGAALRPAQHCGGLFPMMPMASDPMDLVAIMAARIAAPTAMASESRSPGSNELCAGEIHCRKVRLSVGG